MTSTHGGHLASVVLAGPVRQRSSSPRHRRHHWRRHNERSPPRRSSWARRNSSPSAEVFHEEFDTMPEADRLELTKKVSAGITSHTHFFSEEQCHTIEAHIDEMTEQSKRGMFRPFTVDKSPLRCKYFFGEGYTYGSQLERKGPGMEKLYPHGEIDAIPKWIKKLIVRPLEKAEVIPKNWANSAVVNDYLPGGCIVSHVDPMHIFDRPIVSCSFISDCALSFGCKFAFRPIRTSRPVHIQQLPRGCVTKISGFAADGITHCVRPQDVVSRRAVVILRRVLPEAPRLLPEEMLHFQHHHMGHVSHPPPQPPPPPPPFRKRRRRHRSHSPSPKRQRLDSRDHERDKEPKSRPLPSGKVPHCYADLGELEDDEEEEEGWREEDEAGVGGEPAESKDENSENEATAESHDGTGGLRKRNYRKRSN